MGKMVLITWIDSGGVDGRVWDFKDDYDIHVHECQTVGFVVEDTKRHIIVAQSQNPDQWGRLFIIPKGCITATKALSNNNGSNEAESPDARNEAILNEAREAEAIELTPEFARLSKLRGNDET